MGVDATNRHQQLAGAADRVPYLTFDVGNLAALL
jgi:hypothetical protein